jgi:hypothetical protein
MVRDRAADDYKKEKKNARGVQDSPPHGP